MENPIPTVRRLSAVAQEERTETAQCSVNISLSFTDTHVSTFQSL